MRYAGDMPRWTALLTGGNPRQNRRAQPYAPHGGAGVWRWLMSQEKPSNSETAPFVCVKRVSLTDTCSAMPPTGAELSRLQDEGLVG